jgi:hypothetical protein
MYYPMREERTASVSVSFTILDALGKRKTNKNHSYCGNDIREQTFLTDWSKA